ncbi:hypothetical protein ATKI12_4388 [Kitasatospora sp. Ki12]
MSGVRAAPPPAGDPSRFDPGKVVLEPGGDVADPGFEGVDHLQELVELEGPLVA